MEHANGLVNEIILKFDEVIHTDIFFQKNQFTSFLTVNIVFLIVILKEIVFKTFEIEICRRFFCRAVFFFCSSEWKSCDKLHGRYRNRLFGNWLSLQSKIVVIKYLQNKVFVTPIILKGLVLFDRYAYGLLMKNVLLGLYIPLNIP